MTLGQDWERLVAAFQKARNKRWNPAIYIFVTIEELREADNKGIDYAIRRLYADSEYRRRIKLYGAPPSKYPRYPLRVTHQGMFGYREYHYALVGIPELTRGR